MFRKFSRTNTPNRSKIVQNVIKCFITCHDLKKKKKISFELKFPCFVPYERSSIFFFPLPSQENCTQKKKKKKEGRKEMAGGCTIDECA